MSGNEVFDGRNLDGYDLNAIGDGRVDDGQMRSCGIVSYVL